MRGKIAYFLSINYSKNTLKGLILIVFVHSIIPALILISVMTYSQYQRALITHKANISQIASLTANYYEHEFEHSKNILSLMSSLTEIKSGNMTECKKIIDSFISSDAINKYSSLGVANKDGNIFCTSSTSGLNINISDRDYYIKARDTKQFSIGGYILGKVTGKPFITSSYPLFDEKQNFIGIIAMGTEIKRFIEISNNISLPDDYTITIIDQSGIVIARNTNHDRWIGENIKDLPLGKNILNQTSQGDIFTSAGLDNKKRVYATEVINADGFKIYVAIGTPESEIQKIAITYIIRGAILIIAVIAVSGIILAFDLNYIINKLQSTNSNKNDKLADENDK